VKTLSTTCFGLAIFLAVAGMIYLFTAHEYSGATDLLIASVTFAFLGVVLRTAERRAPTEAPGEEELHVEPTIWPLGFAASGAVVAIGVIVGPVMVVIGGIACAVCAAGWIRDVARSHVS
jgi:Cytochrome c oxidase subunit IV